MEHAAFFYQYGAVVPVLHRHRTFRKDGTGRFQHNPQRFHPLFCDCQFFRSHQRFLGKQSFRSRTTKGVFPICHKIIKMGYAIGFPLVGVALFCDYWIIGFYTNNETLVQHTVPPFIVMLFNYIFAVPGYVYISAVTGTGKTKIAFIFQVVTIMVYLLYLYWLSHCVHAPLAVYMTTEYLFVIMLGIQSVIYLKRKHY